MRIHTKPDRSIYREQVFATAGKRELAAFAWSCTKGGVTATLPAQTSEFTFTLDFRQAYVCITSHGCLPTLTATREVQRRIDFQLRNQPRKLALFDNRGTEVAADDVRDCMWDWVAETFSRTALVVNSEMVCVRANMTALMRGVRVRAFSSKVLAASWLLHV